MQYPKNENIFFQALERTLTEVSNHLMALPKIKPFMEAGYNFHNAFDRVMYLERRKQRINPHSLHQED